MRKKLRKNQEIRIEGKVATKPKKVRVRAVGTSFVSTIPKRIIDKFPFLDKAILDVTIIEDDIGNLILIAQKANSNDRVVRY